MINFHQIISILNYNIFNHYYLIIYINQVYFIFNCHQNAYKFNYNHFIQYFTLIIKQSYFQSLLYNFQCLIYNILQILYILLI